MDSEFQEVCQVGFEKVRKLSKNQSLNKTRMAMKRSIAIF